MTTQHAGLRRVVQIRKWMRKYAAWLTQPSMRDYQHDAGRADPQVDAQTAQNA
jgi:hypothetical protein